MLWTLVLCVRMYARITFVGWIQSWKSASWGVSARRCSSLFVASLPSLCCCDACPFELLSPSRTQSAGDLMFVQTHSYISEEHPRKHGDDQKNAQDIKHNNALNSLRLHP